MVIRIKVAMANIKNRDAGLRKRIGFTLIEMMIVIAIGSIIMAIALPPLHRWVVRYNVNEETADIYNTLTEMRFKSLAHKDGKLWGASFTTSSITTFTWDEVKNTSTPVSPPYKLNYSIFAKGAVATAPALLWFDDRGIARRKTGGFYIQTIQINTSVLPAGLSAYDCIAISADRIREGKYNAATTSPSCIVR